MGMIVWGIALIVIGLILGVTGFFGVGGMLQYVGWIVLVIGVILAIVYAIGGASRKTV